MCTMRAWGSTSRIAFTAGDGGAAQGQAQIGTVLGGWCGTGRPSPTRPPHEGEVGDLVDRREEVRPRHARHHILGRGRQ